MIDVQGELWTGLKWRGRRRDNEERSTKTFLDRLEKATLRVLRHDGGFAQCEGVFGDRSNTATTIEYFDWIALQDLRKGLKPLNEMIERSPEPPTKKVISNPTTGSRRS